MTAMSAFITDYETPLRMGAFFGLLLLFGLLERLRPRRRQHVGVRPFATSMAFGVLNAGLLRVVVPGGLVVIAFTYGHNGLMSYLTLPLWVEFIACLVLLDLLLYWQHRLFHKVDWLWRLHSAHHGDRALNVSSAVRFHPGEALLSVLIKGAAIVALGAPVAAVILFEVLLNGAALFNHANWSLGRADAILRKLIVTPDMHRLHHSRDDAESRKNFGFFLSLWDSLFGSYKSDPAQPHETIALGIDDMPDDGFLATLTHPLK